MLFAKVISGVVQAFPYTQAMLRSDYPNVSFPNTFDRLEDFNVFPVIQQDDPAFNPDTHKLVQGTPVFADPDWVVTKVVTPLSASELKEVELQEDKAALKVDAQVLALLKARPSAINNYIDTNVTNLAQAKDVLKILARATAILASAIVN